MGSGLYISSIYRGGERETIIVKGKRKGGPVPVDYTYMYNVIHVRRNLSCPVLNSGRIEYATLLIRKKRKWLDAWGMNHHATLSLLSCIKDSICLSIFICFYPPSHHCNLMSAQEKRKVQKSVRRGISLSPLPLSQSKPDQRHSSQRDRHHHRQNGPRHKRD